MTPIKVLVAEPIYQGLRPEVYANRIAFWNHNCEIERYREPPTSVRSLVIGPGENIRAARNKAIEQALELRTCTHILFLDDDILVPSDLVRTLLVGDHPIVGGLMHRDDGAPIVFERTPDGGERPWFDHPKDEVFQCTAVGAGAMLIKTDVLRDLQQQLPHLNFLFNYDNSRRSMDVLFCRMAIDQGWTVWCNPLAKCEQMRRY